MNEFTAEFGLPDKLLSPNVRAHWAMKARMVKTYRQSCAWAFMAAKPRGWKPGKVVIDVEYRVFRIPGLTHFHPKDEDNCRTSLKALLDGGRDARVFVSDAKDWLRWGDFRLVTTQREVDRLGKKCGVTVTVRRA